MLDCLYYSTGAVVPVFIIVAIGYILKRTGFLSDEFFSRAEWLVFHVALPVMLFLEVASSTVSEALDLKLVLFCVAGILAVFTLSCLIVPLFVKQNDKRGAFIQGVYRSNFAILGIPLAENMFGEEGTKTIAIVMPFAIICFNVLAVIVLTMFEPKDETENRRSAGKIIGGILLGIIKNPLIIAVFLAIPVMLTGFEFPTIIQKPLTYLSNLSTPLALMCLGAGCRLESLKGRAKLAASAIALKIVVVPAIVVTIAVLLGFRGPSLGTIFILFGTPTAVSSFIMAKNMRSDYELASQILLGTTALCLFTIFIGIFILKYFSFI